MKKALILIIPFLTGCASLQPWVEQFNIISVSEESQIGAQAAAEIQKQMTLSQDPVLNQKIQSIGQRLVASLPRKDYAYEFHVVVDKTPNAFTIPGGKIYVHTGLIDFADNSDQLAGVIAHEIGHAYQRHPAKSMSRQYGVEALSQLLFKTNQSQLKSVAVKIAQGSLLNYYGREEEFEADEAGFYILRRSGIPSRGLVQFFTKLQTLQQRGASFAFLSTHPPTPERIARLQALEAGTRQPTLAFQPLAS